MDWSNLIVVYALGLFTGVSICVAAFIALIGIGAD